MIEIAISALLTAFLAGIAYLIVRDRRQHIDGERETFIKIIDIAFADNKDLRDRLFQSKAMPPSDIDLTKVYEERKENERKHKEQSKGKPIPPGPLERLEAKWKDKDLKAAESGVDLTVSSKRVN